MPFSHKISIQGGRPVLALSGRLTGTDQAEALVADFEHLLESGHTQVVLDLAALETMNSSGLNLIIGMFTKARNSGGELSICCIPKKVRELLVMTRLDSIFKIYGSTEEALGHINTQ